MSSDPFLIALDRAADRALSVTELMTLAGQLVADRRVTQALALYRTWIDNHPDDPLLYAVYFNYGSLQSDAGHPRGAFEALSRAIELKPDFLPPYINLGIAEERLGARGEAVQHWYHVVNQLAAITPEALGFKLAALKQIGRVLEAAHIDANAEEALRHSLELDPGQREVAQHWLSLRMRQCVWPVVQPFGAVDRTTLLRGMSPLSLAAYADDPLLHLAMGDAFWRTDAGRPAQILVDRATSLADGGAAAPLRVGYLSSDLREHAVGFLTAALYGCHDRTKVTVFAYYTGHAVTDETQARIRAGVDHWRDVAALSDAEAARLIADDRIQILVDLNGYTQGARQKVLAQRPAPVIVNWLGYPGSTGSPYHDVIIADPVVIPPEAERYYSETVRRLTCYQPNDPHRVVAAPPTRAEVGLPADAMVFCSFNGAQKLTPFTWARWMRILAGVPDGVLWLLDPGEECLARLRARAEDAGVDGARIIAAPRLANPSHLARYPLADLFLDSAPYGAHTTASDALWMGLPVLTLIGRGFAARVCASLVTAAGLPDLVCGDPETYVAQAIALGRDRARLSALRHRLVAGRDACALFDIKGLVRDLEALYAGIWDDHRAGRLARPDLTNLDLYREIGIALDADDVEAGQRPDLDALYRAALAERHRFEVVPADQRLWPGPAQAGAMSGAPARPRTRTAQR